jgi:glutaredoxin
MKDHIVIYMREGCPFCQKVKDHISSVNPDKEIEIYHVDDDFTLEDFKKKYGEDATFPRGYHIKEDGSVVLIGDSGKIINYIE